MTLATSAFAAVFPIPRVSTRSRSSFVVDRVEQSRSSASSSAYLETNAARISASFSGGTLGLPRCTWILYPGSAIVPGCSAIHLASSFLTASKMSAIVLRTSLRRPRSAGVAGCSVSLTPSNTEPGAVSFRNVSTADAVAFADFSALLPGVAASMLAPASCRAPPPSRSGFAPST